MIVTAFILGLLGSAHCVGMCGPIALALPLDRSSRSRAMVGALTYNLGRVITYAILGLIFGLIGKAFSLIGLQQWVSIGAGVLLLLYVILVYGVKRPFQLLPSLTLGLGKLKSALLKQFNKRSVASLFSIGLLNGLLPCGLVYFALVGAIESGAAMQGSIFMALFGLGTAPLMFVTNMLGSQLSNKARFNINKVIPAVLTVFAILFILRGLSLGIPFISPMLDAAGQSAACCHK